MVVIFFIIDIITEAKKRVANQNWSDQNWFVSIDSNARHSNAMEVMPRFFEMCQTVRSLL